MARKAVVDRLQDPLSVEIPEEQSLLCRVSLAKDWKDHLIGTAFARDRTVVLDHKRDARTPRKYWRLDPGKSINVTLDLAEMWFGKFSVRVLDLINNAKTEGEKHQLLEFYTMTKAHAIVKWGDYPRLARAGNGMTYEALGPARFPDVTVTIIPSVDDTESGDPRWKPTRLRFLYDLGEYVDCEHMVNPGGWKARALESERQAQKDFVEASSADRIATLEGQIKTLTELLSKRPDLVAKEAAVLGESKPHAEAAGPEMSPLPKKTEKV